MRTLASRMKWWSWKQSRQDRRSSAFHRIGLSDNLPLWTFQLRDRTRIRNSWENSSRLALRPSWHAKKLTTKSTVRLVGTSAVLGNGLVTEEVLAVQAATQFLQEAQHVVDAVHHRQAEKVLLPVERGYKIQTGGSTLNPSSCTLAQIELQSKKQHLRDVSVQHLISFLPRSLVSAGWRLFSAGTRCRCSPGRPAGEPPRAGQVQSDLGAAGSSCGPGWGRCSPACWCRCTLGRGKSAALSSHQEIHSSVIRPLMSSVAYLLAPGAWLSGEWWRHPEEWSSCLARGCCSEERWPAASSPSWVLAAGGKLIFFFFYWRWVHDLFKVLVLKHY